MGVISKALIFVVLAVGYYFFKNWMNGGQCLSTARIDGKVVIVTGANTGLGKYTAADLALRGGKIYMACRSEVRCNKAVEDILEQNPKLDKKNLIVSNLDLGSKASIRQFVKDFKKKESKLDILINNAGVMGIPESKTADGFETQFGVNHLGHFLLTNLLVDTLISSAPSRVVTVSSMGHQWGTGTINLEDPNLSKNFDTWEAYFQSKLANIIFSKELSRRLKGAGVTTYSVHPGGIATDLQRHIPIVGSDLLQPVASKIFELFAKGIKEGSQTQICCAVDEDLANETGKYYSDCQEAAPGAKGAYDDELAVKLWDLSVKMLKLDPTDIHEKLRN